MKTIFKKGVLLAIGLLLMISCETIPHNDIPLVWDMSSLEQMRVDRGASMVTKRILKTANELCEKQPVAVTDKKKLTFEPDRHYFCCIGPYWWPDSLNVGKYINKDGIVNPESKQYDNVRLIEIVTRCKTLSEAFYISGERKYYGAFVRQLLVWFIDRETYMYPTFEYAQVVPGQNGNKGRSTGLIDATAFNTVLESIRLVNSVKRIDRKTMKSLQRWFWEFAKWADEGDFCKTLRNANNNVGLAYDVTLTNMYLFGGNEKRAKEILDGFSERRLNVQILEDGSQPAELKRTNAVSYSLYNLTHIVDMCYLARYWYPNYYQEHHERIDKAFEFLEQYVKEPEKFPYQQISSWDNCKKNYFMQKERIEKLQN